MPMPPERQALIDRLFTYHAPTDEQVLRMKKIRTAARTLAAVLEENCPPSADRTDAMRKLQELVNTANRCVTFEGESYR